MGLHGFPMWERGPRKEACEAGLTPGPITPQLPVYVRTSSHHVLAAVPASLLRGPLSILFLGRQFQFFKSAPMRGADLRQLVWKAEALRLGDVH